jgi:glycosyltransferase involved in cell wall biosynthesis
VHCVSYYEKRLVQSAFGETSSKITVIRNGVEKEELRKYRLSPREKYKVICAGRLEAYKNVDLVIKAMRKVCRSCPSARLVIVGDGPDQGRLQQLSRAIGLNVQFLGFVDRTQYLHELATSDLLVNVSSREAYGITVCEAAELGVQSLVGCSEALAELANEGIARSAQMPLAVDSLADDIWMCLRNPICPRTESIPAWSEVAERMAELYVS